MKSLTLSMALCLLALPAVSENHAAPTGDAAAGAELFDRQCTSCHVVANAEGEVLAGRSAKTGPNLFGAIGRQVASVDGYRYGQSLMDAGAAGAVLDEANFLAYVTDPTEWLRTTLDDRRARSKMSFKIRSDSEAADIFAFLAQFVTE